MRNSPNPIFVGYFVLGFIILILSVLIFFGKYNFKTKRYILFFNNAVTGLQKGAFVNYRGVKVGTVIDMYATLDAGKVKSQDTSIPVVIELDPEHFKILNNHNNLHSFDQLLESAIDSGLRAQLEIQSFITGLLQIELEFYPESKVVLSHKLFEYKEIPTVSSNFEELTKQLQSFPLKKIGESAVEALDNIKKLAADMNKVVLKIDKDYPHISNDLKLTLKSINNMATNISLFFNSNSQTVQDLSRTLQSIDAAASSVKNLSDNLSANPNSLIMGNRGG